MSLITNDLSSNYKISISIYTIDKEGREKTKIDDYTRELKLTATQLENLSKHLKVVSGTLDEWTIE